MIDVGYCFSITHFLDVDEVKAFAKMVGDYNPLHHDAEFAAATPVGGLIASGTHTSSLMMGALATHFSRSGSVLGVRFSFELISPVFAHEVISIKWEVIATMSRRRGGTFVDLAGTLCTENPFPHLRATATVLVGSSRLQELHPFRVGSKY